MWSVCNYIWKSIQRLFGVNDRSFVYQTVSALKIRLKDGQAGLVWLATVSDLDAIFRVEQDAYDGRAPWNRHALAVDLHYNERAVYFVCEVEQTVIGFVGARFVDEGEVHITNVAVALSHQTKGVAQALLKGLEDFVVSNQRSLISLEVRQSNLRAHALYRMLGYRQTGVKEQYYYPEREDAIEMRKVVKELTRVSEDQTYDYRRLEPSKSCASQLFHVIEEAYAGVAHWSEASFLNDLANENSYYFGAFYQGKLVACIGLQIVLGEGTITNVAVSPLHRRQHVAQALWQFAKEQLALLAIPVDIYFLEVRASNRAAQSFYESEGFTCYFTRQAYYDNPTEDAKLYRLDV